MRKRIYSDDTEPTGTAKAPVSRSLLPCLLKMPLFGRNKLQLRIRAVIIFHSLARNPCMII